MPIREAAAGLCADKGVGLFLPAFAGGVLVLQSQAALPDFPRVVLLSFLAFAALAAAWKLQSARPGLLTALSRAALFIAGGIGVGFVYAALRADVRLAERLPESLESRDVRVRGVVASLPAVFSRGARFVFEVEEVWAADRALSPEESAALADFPRRLWITFYTRGFPKGGNAAGTLMVPQAGDRWEYTLRLKRPHGSVNPRGADYEAWLLERGLRATGYVRAAPAPAYQGVSFWPPMRAVHRLRGEGRDRLRALLPGAETASGANILLALTLGDQRALTPEEWQGFTRTGTAHLLAISGLHVTLVAALAAFLLGGLWKRSARLCLCFPAPHAAVLGGALAAAGYALMSGLGIPAQRALIMLSLVAFTLLLRRRVSFARVLLLALSLVLLYDPWAVLAAGFWLSFVLVAALAWAGQHQGAQEETSGGLRFFRKLRLFFMTQWAATCMTLPLLLFFFQRFPLISPFANVLAIPWIGLIVTPLALLAAAFVWLPPLAGLLLWIAQTLLTPMLLFLGVLANAPQWTPPAAPAWAVLLAVAGFFVLFLPRGIPGKISGIFLFFPLLFRVPPPSLPEGALRMTVFDVGQGQAVLLETARRRLLYDAGPSYDRGARAEKAAPATGQDAASRVVLPHLAAFGVARLDALVLSHRDDDHAGGWESLKAALPIDLVVSSWPELPGSRLCGRAAKRGGLRQWEWDGVRFVFLHPPEEKLLRGGNGDSCVLKITAAGGRVLLTGDIGKREERRLLRDALPDLAAEVVLAPHHGSRTSSSLPFVAAVGADWVIFSAGYRNRYGHPHPETEARYALLGATALRTDRDGALRLTLDAKGVEVKRAREEFARYWHDKLPEIE
ncbi:MAG: DNA internalization-related competence protein ComEC/Rec2 [Zoogloeaceae bacterium]|jgi:competence protein ComEC|nr:DNA internalization-related competence protein ComEC/Rec2 [Zoogloeaceae bacterium]